MALGITETEQRSRKVFDQTLKRGGSILLPYPVYYYYDRHTYIEKKKERERDTLVPP